MKSNMIKGVDYPTWLTDSGLKTLQKGYLLKDESVFDMYRRVSIASATRINRLDMADRFYNAMANNWLCPATPVAANMGTTRGLPISCYGLTTPDSVDEIYMSVREMAILSKHGGGVGVGLSRIRSRGALIKGGLNGASEGVVPWAKSFDSATVATSQGNVRRGATSVNLHVDHDDIEEFLRIRRQTGDVNRQCLNINHCIVISDSFMKRIEQGEEKARKLWIEILKTRLETGEPYLMFEDTINNANPEAYRKNNLHVEMTNICSEITLHTDEKHSFVCCLSSLNLARWDEWKDTDLPELAVYFLDGVIEEFIDRAKEIPGFEKTVRSAIKGRAIGIGALGWHSLLQSKMIPFESYQAMQLNAEIFRTIKEKAENATRRMAQEMGEPEWCKGTGRRHSHLIAIAPTRSNSIISGEVSYGIEPIPANAYTDKTSKGVFLTKSILLERLLESRGMNDRQIWKSIVTNSGSVQHLDCLTDHEKEVFKTAREINQMALVQQAAQRQKWIDQAQSLNLFFPVNVEANKFNKVHYMAWKLGVKTLYYVRSSSVLKADASSREAVGKPNIQSKNECGACEG